jgi:hypothetical protein
MKVAIQDVIQNIKVYWKNQPQELKVVACGKGIEGTRAMNTIFYSKPCRDMDFVSHLHITLIQIKNFLN